MTRSQDCIMAQVQCPYADSRICCYLFQYFLVMLQQLPDSRRPEQGTPVRHRKLEALFMFGHQQHQVEMRRVMFLFKNFRPQGGIIICGGIIVGYRLIEAKNHIKDRMPAIIGLPA